MKKMLYAVAILAVVLVGCNKKDEPKTETQDKLTTGSALTQYLTASALVTNAVTESANGVATVQTKTAAAPAAAPAAAEVDTFPKIDVQFVDHDYNFPVIVTIDYGTKNVLGKDGRNHRGVLKVWADGAYESEGTKMAATFTDWYVDDVKLECNDTMYIENGGRDSLNHCMFIVDGKFTLISGEKSFEFSEQTFRTWIEGEGNKDVTKHTYSITGDQEGKTAGKYDYKVDFVEADPMVVNVGTRFPLSGSLEIYVDDTRAIDEFFPNFEYAELVKMSYPINFKFTLIFTGNNKAKVQIPYIDFKTQEENIYESKEIDLLNI